ncbi:G5-interacting protein [Novymonas esmeraldas]|uniref:G5-interacting protein n=1 Tax=Novymonas esmeraldas TaxID=1808958 RepID=A0AAW0F3Q2_9TRYP
MSNLNPNAPSFAVSQYQSGPMQNNPNYNSNNGGGGGGGPGGMGPPMGGMGHNERYGGSMMYEGGYGRGNGGGYNNYNMNQVQQQGYPPPTRGGRGNRQMGGSQPHYANPNMMGGGGAMRSGVRGPQAPYHPGGGMDMQNGYDQMPPPPQQQQQQQMHNMAQRMPNMQPPNVMGMNNSGMGSGGSGRTGYGGSQRTPVPQMPPNMSHHGNMGMGPAAPLPPPPQPIQTADTMARPPSVPLGPAGPLAQAAPPLMEEPPYVTRSTPQAVMVVGYRKTGKTRVAQVIAKRCGLEYVCLRSPQSDPPHGAGGEGGEDEEEEDADDVSPVQRLAPLRDALAAGSAVKGVVIDDAFSTNKYHAYYVVHYLAAAGLRLDAVVAVVPDLSSLEKRGVSFSGSYAKMAHPEAFEFASSLDPDRVIVVDEDARTPPVAEKAAAEAAALLKRGDAAITLETVHFIPDCPMVTDPEVVEQIIKAEGKAAKRLGPYKFTYSEPNYVLDYVQFVQSAAKLEHYLIVPWIWGDRLSLIGYEHHVYVHLTSYNLIFELREVPEVLQGLCKNAQPDADAAAADDEGAVIRFLVEGTMLDDVIYISDMMVLRGQNGCEVPLHDRVKLLTESFGKLPSTCQVRLLEHYAVSDIKKCLEANKSICRGAIFINPGGVEYGQYDVRNFVYPLEAKKTVRLRIWSGNVTDGTWSFDGYVRESKEEVLATTHTAGAAAIPVLISDSSVETFLINDGNIIECTMEKTAAKGKSREKGSVLTFCRRCKWEVAPITQFYMWAFTDPPRWSTDSFMDACSSITPTRPA